MAVRLPKSTLGWRRRLIWGLVLAGGLGALSVAFEHGEPGVRLAIVLAVAGLVLPIVVETRFRIEELAARLRSELAAEAAEGARRADRLALAQEEFKVALLQYTAFAQAPASTRAFVAEAAADWQRVEDHRSVFLGWLRKDHEQEFRTKLRHLANGLAILDRHSQHSFRTIPMDGFARIQSLSATNPGYWNTPRGRRYLENQRIAIQNQSLTVMRTMVLGISELEFAGELMQQQLDAGVQLSIILRDEVTDSSDQGDLLNDFTIVVDKGGVTGVMRPGNQSVGESFTTDEGEVVEAARVLAALSPYQREVADLFPGLPTAT